MSDSSRTFHRLPEYADRESVENVLAFGQPDELAVLALSLGESFPDFEYAQTTCLQLTDHPDPWVRSSACLGLAYLARTRGQLDLSRAVPVLQRELRAQVEHRGRIEDAVSDIEMFLSTKIDRD